MLKSLKKIRKKSFLKYLSIKIEIEYGCGRLLIKYGYGSYIFYFHLSYLVALLFFPYGSCFEMKKIIFFKTLLIEHGGIN